LSAAPAAWPWLVSRPIAHRGLHAKSQGIIENSLAAAAAAIARNYAIECDVQMTKDGEAVVFHDEKLDRLTPARGDLHDRSALEVVQIGYRDGEGRIPLLTDLLAAVAGRVPLIVEIKSQFDDDFRLAARVAALIANYNGPLALKSFDPAILAHFRKAALARPLGLVAQASYDEADWPDLSWERRQALATFACYERTRPDFLSWNIADLPHATTTLWRSGLCLPLLTWTVRTSEQAGIAARFADQIVFEGLDPEAAFSTNVIF
jgi:glycerophosphoryl diester phosphodiesterase